MPNLKCANPDCPEHGKLRYSESRTTRCQCGGELTEATKEEAAFAEAMGEKRNCGNCGHTLCGLSQHKPPDVECAVWEPKKYALPCAALPYAVNLLNSCQMAKENAALRAKVAGLEAELREGDYWQERATDYLESGGCPICFATDEEGHKKGCVWGEAVARVAELEAWQTKAIERLRRNEWELKPFGFGYSDWCCPDCGSSVEEKHKDDCQLAALLND